MPNDLRTVGSPFSPGSVAEWFAATVRTAVRWVRVPRAAESFFLPKKKLRTVCERKNEIQFAERTCETESPLQPKGGTKHPKARLTQQPKQHTDHTNTNTQPTNTKNRQPTHPWVVRVGFPPQDGAQSERRGPPEKRLHKRGISLSLSLLQQLHTNPDQTKIPEPCIVPERCVVSNSCTNLCGWHVSHCESHTAPTHRR